MKKSKKFKTTYRLRKNKTNRRKLKTEKEVFKGIKKEVDIVTKIKREYRSKKERTDATLLSIVEKYYNLNKVQLIENINEKLIQGDYKKIRINSSVKTCFDNYKKLSLV